MKFLKHIRSRSRIKDELPQEQAYCRYSPEGSDRISSLPTKVLSQIFQAVGSDVLDDSYASLEETTNEGCLLCDVRDLAACAGVCKRWHDVAQNMLYTHITIDAVHYCERELELAEKRKRKKLNRNAEPFDPPKVRLQLFSRTVRENGLLASSVLSLRIPYMTRESSKGELARTVSALHNLRYVDLPEGFFNDEPSCSLLKQELQASCPEIRRMRYGPGSEKSFVFHVHKRIWQNMEIMELAGIHVESHDLLFVLSSFPVLQELKLVDLPWLEDAVFYPNTGLPGFPPIQRLTFSNTPQVRAAGLVTYLAQPQNREVLTELNLSKTGVQAHHLYLILSKAPYLTKVSVSEDVERSIPLSPPTPALTSSSLKILHFEITARHSAHHNIHPPTESYYSYLASSLLSNSLPSLTDLFVRDPEFPETLLLPLPPHGRPFSSYSNTAASSPPTSPGFAPPAGLSQPLSIYTKGQDDLEWNFTSIAPPSSAGRGGRSATRPISLMGAESLSPAWGGSARKSVIVGNGLGGFLAVPSEELPRRPESSSSNKSVGESSWAGLTGSHGLPDRSKKERKDLWR